MTIKRLAAACAMTLMALAFASCASVNAGGKGPASPSAERMSMEEAVRRAVDGLADAYQREDIGGFMALVSERFTGDTSILDSSVRRDFSAYTDIDIRLNVDSVTFDGVDRAFVSVTFTRSHTDTGTGARASRSGSTFFVFRHEDGAWRLWSAGVPPVFGVSG
ncbi:MAG: hypothetical protein HZA22_00120 [Nitrospirae bacterium]|nr:hypothetical protein [Nitrospirota bacterium]MBI5695482.1 hypothetical protein [Nitrospirota bacterium]